MARRLEAVNASPTWIAMVRVTVALDDADKPRIFGKLLPPRLQLIH
jgi:hypothetical protein